MKFPPVRRCIQIHFQRCDAVTKTEFFSGGLLQIQFFHLHGSGDQDIVWISARQDPDDIFVSHRVDRFPIEQGKGFFDALFPNFQKDQPFARVLNILLILGRLHALSGTRATASVS